MTRWSSHSEATLQASLDDVDWDMFRASSSDVSEFTEVALSFVCTLTEQATETVTIKTFSNQKPWVDRTIRDAVNHRTAAYNAGILSGNMSEYKASCYALRRAVRAAKRRYSERTSCGFLMRGLITAHLKVLGTYPNDNDELLIAKKGSMCHVSVVFCHVFI